MGLSNNLAVLRRGLIFLIITASFLLMLNAAKTDSLIIGEPLSSTIEIRVISIIITITLLLFVYFFAKELLGRWWAVLPLLFTGFSPTILAYGHYAVNDIVFTLAILAALFFFTRSLTSPAKMNIFFAAMAFGSAQASNLSSVILIPYFLLIILIFYAAKIFKNNNLESGKTLIQLTLLVLGIILIGYLFVVYPVYLTKYFETESPPFHASQQFIYGPMKIYLNDLVAYYSSQSQSILPWWHYLIIYPLKEPMPLLITILFAAIMGIIYFLAGLNFNFKITGQKFNGYLNTYGTEFSLLIFAVLYWKYISISPGNGGINKLLPILPIMHILAAIPIKKWFARRPHYIATTLKEKIMNWLNSLISFWLKSVILGIMAIWLIISVFLATPHFLSYANGLFKNNYQYPFNYGIDLGQDLKRLKEWADINLEPSEIIAVDYFGTENPNAYLGARFAPWHSSDGNPKENGIGWFALSVNNLQTAMKNPDEYRWLENLERPIDLVGKTILIYRL
ncbi:MAG: hypothetical protein A3I89_03300 [Candidatus Harrisonbacteria bacterium RIFCSPLOWO2_02_FULL_41_11]|uniref:Glycosyltransferase RgtA/B/C/D-like domain-containing protein n=1 Tax=Candidatus Harrisonbacteria bacterium RIFCSPHIGHO2_02_FULL_42_16 TaxID=1798404 RepID=A0A1G1ZIN1_9BACT|nr:MAG: hypothetical protein A3B92_02790 [Candidatus Harrisonbacteria bacterium RIFCSPHIGHO2_02_FULL_42_16]OGY66264.1 MAG: hypothetical protein A3I89_03300 [Candidatus Harrisonbacteria bacterium RIFCSPLOWO2_02_FULL_41_11]